MRTLMNKLPSVDSVNRTRRELERQQRELTRRRRRTRDEDNTLAAVTQRLDAVRKNVLAANAVTEKIQKGIMNIQIPNAACAEALVESFVGAVNAASTQTKDDGGERSLYEAPTQLCVALKREKVWPGARVNPGGAAAAGPGTEAAADAPFEWGGKQFGRLLANHCQANFTDIDSDDTLCIPYVKLVGYLYNAKFFRAAGIIHECQRVLALRLSKSTTLEQAECRVKHLRTFLEIVAPNPQDKLEGIGKKVLQEIVDTKWFRAFETLGDGMESLILSSRAVSEAGIYLGRRDKR